MHPILAEPPHRLNRTTRTKTNAPARRARQPQAEAPKPVNTPTAYHDFLVPNLRADLSADPATAESVS